MRRWIAVIATTGALALAALVQPIVEAADQEVPVPPNVLLIVTDDQRVDTMEAMPKTQRLFVERGTSFTSAFSTTPLCCPSRASILTGLYAHNHHVTRQSRAGQTLDVGQTLQRYLSELGYYTGIAGKWLNGWDLEVVPPYLNEVAIFNSSGTSYDDARWNVDGTTRIVDGYSTDFMVKRVEGFIRRAEGDDDRPWFLVLAPPHPHSPFQAEPRHAEERFGRWEGNPAVGEADKSDKPDWVQNKNAGYYHGRRIRTKQLRTLRSVDHLVGKTFAALRGYSEAGDTLAIFTSDNGYLWGEHGIVNIKRFPYTQSVQVPLYLRWPGRVIGATSDERLAANIDIAPTILEAAGAVDRVAELDGRSLLQPSARRRLLLEYWTSPENALRTWASIRAGDYQYIEYYDDAGRTVYREYYDLVEDPFQLDNLLDNGTPLDDPEWVTLSNDLEQMRECRAATCP